MSTYQELLESMPESGKDCGLGRILKTEGRKKHDKVLAAIFAINPKTERLFSNAKLAVLFRDEYGWSEYFFRRHRNGTCVSCLNRT
jgi:hypothetical protein